MTWSRQALIGAVGLALVATSPARASCKLGVMATLPITMQGLRPTTTAQINGVDAPFLVDSGAFYSVITPGSARQFGLRLEPGPFGFTMRGVGGSANVMIATVQKFGIAGQTLPKVQFIVGGSEVGNDNGGVIGYNILGLADAEYDLAHGQVRLIKPSGCTRADFPFWVKSGQAYSDLDIEPGVGRRADKIMASATINGTRIQVQFDTGADGSVVSRAAALRAGIDVAGPGAITSGFTTGFGRHMIRQWIVPVAAFKIGDEEIRKTSLRVVDSLVAGADTPDMLLGADFFLSHHIYVAHDLHKLYFTYNGGNVFNLRPVTEVAATADGPPAAGEPTTAEALARRGAASAGRHVFGAAIADLSRAVALEPTEPHYLAERAQAYLGNHQPFHAMADLDAALKLRPADVPTLMTRAAVRLTGHDKAGALADVTAADAAAPHEADVRFRIGQFYEQLDALPAAIVQYDQWLAAHHDDVKVAAAYNSRCWARALLGTELDFAEKDCAAAHRLDGANLSFLDSRGLVRLRRGDYGRAVADYDTVLARNPKVAWSLYGRGIAKFHLGDAAGGRNDLTAATAIAPDLATFARAHGVEPPAAAAPATASNP